MADLISKEIIKNMHIFEVVKNEKHSNRIDLEFTLVRGVLAYNYLFIGLNIGHMFSKTNWRAHLIHDFSDVQLFMCSLRVSAKLSIPYANFY